MWLQKVAEVPFSSYFNLTKRNAGYYWIEVSVILFLISESYVKVEEMKNSEKNSCDLITREKSSKFDRIKSLFHFGIVRFIFFALDVGFYDEIVLL